jgi:hypothetical protein
MLGIDGGIQSGWEVWLFRSFGGDARENVLVKAE